MLDPSWSCVSSFSFAYCRSALTCFSSSSNCFLSSSSFCFSSSSCFICSYAFCNWALWTWLSCSSAAATSLTSSPYELNTLSKASRSFVLETTSKSSPDAILCCISPTSLVMFLSFSSEALRSPCSSFALIWAFCFTAFFILLALRPNLRVERVSRSLYWLREQVMTKQV